MTEVPQYRIRSAQQYIERYSARLTQASLGERALYMLMMQGEGSGAPGAVEAPVFIHQLRRYSDRLGMKLSFADDDGFPGSEIIAGLMLNNFWHPDITLQLKLSGYAGITRVRNSYVLSYEGEGLDDIDRILEDYSHTTEDNSPAIEEKRDDSQRE